MENSTKAPHGKLQQRAGFIDNIILDILFNTAKHKKSPRLRRFGDFFGNSLHLNHCV